MTKFLETTDELRMARLPRYVDLIRACALTSPDLAENDTAFDNTSTRWELIATRIQQEQRGCEIFIEVFGFPGSAEGVTLRCARKCVSMLRQMGLLPPGGSTKKLDWLAGILGDVNLGDVLEVVMSMGGLEGFRERVALLRALNLGDGQGAEARREKAQWMEVFAEVSRHHGAEAFLAYFQSLQKYIGLCR